MAELTPMLDEAKGSSQPRGPLFYIGGFALLAAMTIETIAVIGRHAGLPLLGALELMQMTILLSASSAMLIATLNDSHATVTFLTDRLQPQTKFVLRKFAYFCSALFFVAITIGSGWIALEHWNTHEQSELLHIPYRPLRAISVIVAATIAVVFVRELLRSRAGASK